MSRPRQVGVVGLASATDRNADVVAVAHQEQLRHLAHREREADNAVASVVGCIRQRRHDGLWHGRTVITPKVQLLFGQVQLTGAYVLVGVELDLLEANDA